MYSGVSYFYRENYVANSPYWTSPRLSWAGYLCNSVAKQIGRTVIYEPSKCLLACNWYVLIDANIARGTFTVILYTFSQGHDVVARLFCVVLCCAFFFLCRYVRPGTLFRSRKHINSNNKKGMYMLRWMDEGLFRTKLWPDTRTASKNRLHDCGLPRPQRRKN